MKTNRRRLPASPRVLGGVLSVLLAAQAGGVARAATVAVTTNADAGAGSLRSGVFLDGGGNTFAWGAGSGGTLTLGSALNLGANTVLDVTGAPSAVTIAGSTLGLGGATSLANSNAGQAFAVSSLINGGGSLTKTGVGRVDLTGANAYTGGTAINAGVLSANADAALGDTSGVVTFNGGTLATTASFGSARTVVLNGNGTFDTTGGDLTLSGTLTGSGGVVKLGTGLLSLTGSNSYGGGTFIDQGTLGINSFAALGGGGLTLNGGALQFQANLSSNLTLVLNGAGGSFDTAGTTSTLSGLITGVGGLTKVSSGTLVLSGANAYSGGTTVAGGVLQVSADANLGDPSGGLTLNGGALQTSASVTTARGVNLGAGGGTIDTNGYDSYFSGAFTGAGALTKVGAGALVLSGGGSYLGGTIVDAGTLRYGASGVLPTGGALTVASGATVDLGGFSQNAALGLVNNAGLIDLKTGNLNLGGGYAGAGTLKLLLQPGVTPISGGAVNVTGGTLAVGLADPAVASGQTFVPIAVGALTGTFASISAPAALSFTPTYYSTAVVLTVGFVPFGTLGANPNQNAVGAGLEPARTNPTGDMATVMASLYSLNGAQLQSALDQIGPVALESMASLSLAGADSFEASVARRARAVTDAAASGAPAGGPAFGFFVSPLYGKGSVSSALNDAGGQPGQAFNTAGLALGADMKLGSAVAVGVTGGYQRGHASVAASAPATVDVDSARLGAYLSAGADDIHAHLFVGGAQDFYATSRGIAFDTVSRTAQASPRGDQLDADASFGWDMKPNEQVAFSPFFGLTYDRLRVSPFNEHGADSLDLSVGPQTARSMRGTMGLRYSERTVTELGAYSTYLSAALRHEFRDQNRQIGAALAEGQGAPFAVATGDVGRTGSLLGGGLSADVSSVTSVAVEYLADLRPRFTEQTLNATLRYRF